MKKRIIILQMMLLILPSMLFAQQINEIIKKGNDLYKQQQYEPAKSAYDQALEEDSTNTTAKFNLGNTSYRLAKPDEALRTFDQLSAKYKASGDKAKAYYNKGVVLTNQKRLEESIDAYKDALRQDPNDKEARENLQKALMELKRKTPPPKKDNQKKKQENKKQQPKMDRKEAEQKLKLLEQKEKELQQRMQQQKTKTSSGGSKDW